MTDVDTSIYKNTATPLDPLKTYGQALGIQGAQQQNRLTQQSLDLRAGMGDAFRAAVDPNSGKVDTNRLQAIVSQDPRTAWNTGDVVQQAQANDQATSNAKIAQLNSVQAHIQAANGYIAAQLGNAQIGVSDQYDSIVKGINDMATHGDSLMTPQERDQMIAQVPKGDPIAQKQFVLNAANQNFAAQKQIQPLIDQAGGTPITTNDGQVIRGGTQASALRGGAINVPPQQGVQTQTGPGENASLVTVTLSDGTKIMVPRSTLPGASGIAGGGRAVAPPQAAPAPAAAPAMPGAAAPGNRLAAPQVAPAAPAPPAAAPILAAPPPGVSASQDADVTRYKTDQASIPTHATNVQSLQKAQTALEALAGPLGTGKGTEALSHMKAVMSSLGIGFNDSTLNYDEAKKYLTAYASQQGTAGHSDLQLQASQGSNASTGISNAAALDVVKTNIGRENQAIAQVLEHNNPTGIGYGDSAAKFAKTTDPRAFGWDQYTHDEQKKIISGLDSSGKQKLLRSLDIAKKHGFVIPGGAGNGG